MTKEQLKELSAQLDLATKQLENAAKKLVEAGCQLTINVSTKTKGLIKEAEAIGSLVTLTATERL